MTIYDLIYYACWIVAMLLCYAIGYYFGMTDEQKETEKRITRLVQHLRQDSTRNERK